MLDVDDFIEVGIVVGAYGIHGWTRIRPYGQHRKNKSVLLEAKRWRLTKEGEIRTVNVLQARLHSGQTIAAQFAEYAYREHAQTLKGARVWIRRTDFPALKPDEYYWVDLIGLNVFNLSGASLGKVVGLIDNSAHSVLRVAYPYPLQDSSPIPRNDEQLIPFVNAYIREVDFVNHKLTVDWEVTD